MRVGVSGFRYGELALGLFHFPLSLFFKASLSATFLLAY